MKSDKNRARLRDDIPHPGIGLFVDDRAKASAESAHACVVASLEDTKLPDVEDLQRRLLEISRHYWADHDFDDRASSVEIRDELRALRRALDKVAKVVTGDALSDEARAALRAEAHRRMRGASGDPIETLLTEVAVLQSICEPFVSHRGTKGPRAQDRVSWCCARLWKLREHLTGRPFAKTLEPEFVGPSNAPSGFKGTDAQFVFAVIQAIDEKVTFSQVHDGLSSHPASTSRRK